jgi:hypothetical protein
VLYILLYSYPHLYQKLLQNAFQFQLESIQMVTVVPNLAICEVIHQLPIFVQCHIFFAHSFWFRDTFQCHVWRL